MTNTADRTIDNSTITWEFPERAGVGDLTGGFCTSGSERKSTLEGRWYADEKVQAGADRELAAAN